ncbi:MAG: SRPBCC family protein [Opitutus sp.]
MIHRLRRQQFVHGNPREIWKFFSRPENLNEITPPSFSFRIIGEVEGEMYAGQLIEYRIGVLPGLRTRWLTEITHVRPGDYFIDEQRRGPYRLWHHEHRFIPGPDRHGVTMVDTVTYDVGWGVIGSLLHRLWIKSQLDTIFRFRAQKIAELFPERCTT